MHEFIYLIQVFILILHCFKQLHLFEMTTKKEYDRFIVEACHHEVSNDRNLC